MVDISGGDVDRAHRAHDRAVVLGRPTDDRPADQFFFDAVDALVKAETDAPSATTIARRLAALPAEISEHVYVGDGWLITGEILTLRPGKRPKPVDASAASSATASAPFSTTWPMASRPWPARSAGPTKTP